MDSYFCFVLFCLRWFAALVFLFFLNLRCVDDIEITRIDEHRFFADDIFNSFVAKMKVKSFRHTGIFFSYSRSLSLFLKVNFDSSCFRFFEKQFSFCLFAFHLM